MGISLGSWPPNAQELRNVSADLGLGPGASIQGAFFLASPDIYIYVYLKQLYNNIYIYIHNIHGHISSSNCIFIHFRDGFRILDESKVM